MVFCWNVPVLREDLYDLIQVGAPERSLLQQDTLPSVENKAMYSFVKQAVRVDHASSRKVNHGSKLVNYFQLLLIVIRNKQTVILHDYSFIVFVS